MCSRQALYHIMIACLAVHALLNSNLLFGPVTLHLYKGHFHYQKPEKHKRRLFYYMLWSWVRDHFPLSSSVTPSKNHVAGPVVRVKVRASLRMDTNVTPSYAQDQRVPSHPGYIRVIQRKTFNWRIKTITIKTQKRKRTHISSSSSSGTWGIRTN